MNKENKEDQLFKPMLSIPDYIKIKNDVLIAKFLRFKHAPKLCIIQIGHDKASDIYVKGKCSDGKKVGVTVEVLQFSATSTEKDILRVIRKLNKKRSVDGILVQLPFPPESKINVAHIQSAIAPLKDVDGFSPNRVVMPCTPQGIVNYLEYTNFVFTDKNAVVIGRSDIVGKPMASLLTAKNCNVTVLHSKTTLSNMKTYLKNADLIVCAVGAKHLINCNYSYKPDAWVIDVGINRGEDGHITGDCDKNLPVAYQSPVPGGVGLLTRECVFENLLTLIERKRDIKNGISH